LARRNLPPLRALTAFEAAARLGSFRKAADELGITRSAISHQIKLLEDILGVDLFSRDGKRAELTGPGQVYYPAVREAFDQIESQTQVIRPRASENELTVQVYVTVAMKWLLPRLHDFERRYPNMRVRLSTSYFHWDYDPENADVGIILARNRDPGPSLCQPLPLGAEAGLLAGLSGPARTSGKHRRTLCATGCCMSIPARRTGGFGSRRPVSRYQAVQRTCLRQLPAGPGGRCGRARALP
jgi:DNA-binding transcriptional LysR family regulator